MTCQEFSCARSNCCTTVVYEFLAATTMVLHHLGVLLLCLASASSLPLASATSSQTTVKTTATKSAKLGGRLGRKSALDAQRFLAAATKQSVATPVSGEKEPKAPAHCRDTKAGCTHAAKVKARAKKAAKLPAAEQAEAKQKAAGFLPTFGGLAAALVAEHKVATATPSTSAVHRGHPKRAKVAAARASAAEATWSRFDQGNQGDQGNDQGEQGHEDRSGHAGATVRTMPTGGKPGAFQLFQPGAFYP